MKRNKTLTLEDEKPTEPKARELVLSDPDHEADQVLDHEPILTLPEPFPMDYPILALYRAMTELERQVKGSLDLIREGLAALERNWPRKEDGTPIVAMDLRERPTVPCDDYENHRSAHRREDGQWVCLLCREKKNREAVPEPVAPLVADAIGDDLATEAEWVCPDHGKSVLRRSLRTGRDYRACPDPECVEQEP